MEATRLTGLVYDARMEEHRMEFTPWHPELPERIRLPWEALERGGYSKRCQLIKVRINVYKGVCSLGVKIMSCIECSAMEREGGV